MYGAKINSPSLRLLLPACVHANPLFSFRLNKKRRQSLRPSEIQMISLWFIRWLLEGLVSPIRNEMFAHIFTNHATAKTRCLYHKWILIMKWNGKTHQKKKYGKNKSHYDTRRRINVICVSHQKKRWMRRWPMSTKRKFRKINSNEKSATLSLTPRAVLSFVHLVCNFGCRQFMFSISCFVFIVQIFYRNILLYLCVELLSSKKKKKKRKHFSECFIHIFNVPKLILFHN